MLRRLVPCSSARKLDRWIVERYHDPSDDPDQPVDMVGVRLELENNLLVT